MKNNVPTGEIHPVFLYFKDRKIEQAFRLSVVERDRRSIRFVFIVFIVLYAVFSFLDLRLAPQFVEPFFRIRFLIVIPIFLITLLSTYTRYFQHIYQTLLFISSVAGGLGIVVMLILYPQNLTYYGGLFLIFYSSFFLLRLRFIYAVAASWVIFFAFFIGMYFFGPFENAAVSVGMSLFYISSIVIGTYGTYSIEQYSRKNYFQNRRIEYNNSLLENRVLSQTNEIITAQIMTIFSLAKLVESRDKETGLHVERVGKYCRLIAQALPDAFKQEINMPLEEFSNVIEFASALHDIGKVGVEDQILNKSDVLSEIEFEKIKQHTIIGSATLLNVQNRYPNNKYINMGVEISRWHHERFDGSGYPDGLKGNRIPVSARIMAVADVYDALRSNRSYKKPFSHQKAVVIIKQEAGTHFDPMIVEAFLQQENLIESLSESLS